MKHIAEYIGSYRFVPEGEKWPVSVISGLWAVLLITAIVHGTLLRVGDQQTKNLWVDEVWRAQQIYHAPSYEVLQRGEYKGMEAPVQYSEYLLGKLGLAVFGKSEIAFRMWPLIASLAALLLFAYTAGHLFSAGWSAAAVFLFAIGIGYVEHAHEFKPYALEVLCSIAALALGVCVDRSERRELTWLFIPLFLVMVLGTNIGLFFAFLPLFLLYKRDLQAMRRCLAVGGIVACVCAAAGAFYYWGYVEQLRENAIFEFWSGYYLSDPARLEVLFLKTLPRTLWLYVDSYNTFLKYNWEPAAVVGLLAFVISPMVMVYRRSLLVLYVLAIGLLQLLLAVLELYPFLSRVGAFYYPFLILSLCYLGDSITGYLGRKLGIAASIAGLVMCSWLYYDYWRSVPISLHAGTNRHIEQIKPLVELLRRSAVEGDILSPNYSAKISLRFYGPELFDRLKVVGRPVEKNLTPDIAKVYLRKLTAKHENCIVWLLTTHNVGGYQTYLDAAETLKLRIVAKKSLKGSYLIGLWIPKGSPAEPR